MNRIAAFLIAAALAPPAWAHEGEEHGEPAASVVATALAPRAASTTETFELVAVAANSGLVLYLDRFPTNEPVAGAQLDVQSATLNTSARQREPGVYEIATDHFTRPGKYPLTIFVQAGDATDLMTATLEVPAPPASDAGASDRSRVWKRPAVWGTSGALLLAGVGLVAVRRKSRSAGKPGPAI